MSKVPVEMILNGEERAEFIDSGITLLKFLRDKINDFTAKAGCLQGTCGACTVLVDGVPRLSCITLADDCGGRAVETVAGLAKDGQLHPLQRAFADHFATQCGFCTPGMLMVALDFLRLNPEPDDAEIREAISAVLCRCTGYRDIVRSVAAAAKAMRKKSGDTAE